MLLPGLGCHQPILEHKGLGSIENGPFVCMASNFGIIMCGGAALVLRAGNGPPAPAIRWELEILPEEHYG